MRPSSWVSLRLVRAHDLDREGWAGLARALKPVVEPTIEMNLIELLQSIKRADAMAWNLVTTDGRVSGAVVCKVMLYASGYNPLLIVAGASVGTRISRENMRAVISHFELIAKDMGLDAVRVCGRHGWGKVFPDYEHTSSTFDKIVQRGN